MNENQQVEWKETWRDEYLKWIAGFANADGGLLVIGKNDSGVPVGVQNAKRLLEEIPNKVRDVLGIMVAVNLRVEAGKDLLEIVVEAYPNPVSYKGEYHYRSGSTKQELKGAALDRFLLRKYGLRHDALPVPGFGIRDCSPAAFALFRSKAAKSERMTDGVLGDSDQHLLENLHLTQGAYLKRAAALLFCDDPEKFVNGASIKIGFFVTDDDLRYQDEIHGNLFAQVERTLELLTSKYLKAYISYEGIQRIERFLFPPQALREAVLNAVVHKDYNAGIPIQISVYEDHLVIWNPGQLPEDWTLERLLGKHPSSAYNPLIADAFFRAGYIESWGRGIEKINRECFAHGIAAPLYDDGMSGLMLTFWANSEQLKNALLGETPVETSVGLGEKLGEKLGETRAAIVLAMQNNPRITTKQLATALNISTTAVEKQLQYLKRNNHIERIGPDKGGHWKVLI